MALLAGHQTCVLQVAGWSPGWASLHSGLCASVANQYNLVQTKEVISLAGKVTMGLVECNSSLPPGL